MRRFWTGMVLAAALAACGQADQSSPVATEAGEAYGGMAAMEQAQGRADMDDAVAPAAAPPPPGDASTRSEAGTSTSPSQPGGPNPVLYLAYTYTLGLEIPSERLTGVMDRHIQACQTAGPRVCQLITSNRSGSPDSDMNGFVSLRAEPTWLNTFKAGIAQQADEAGGRVDSENTTSEDLTRQIVDTEARLRAQTTLRDRLQELLRTSRGRLSDLLEVERELARVQGEIDSVQSQLAVMRTRVSMSELTLSYHSSPRSLGSDTFEPLRQAFASFLGIIVGGFAAIIVIIAGLIPFAVVLIPAIWLLLRWRRGRGGRFFSRKQTPPAPTPEA